MLESTHVIATGQVMSVLWLVDSEDIEADACLAVHCFALREFGAAPLGRAHMMHPMSSGVRELRVWQESVSLAGDVIRVLRQSIRRETKSVSDEVMATAVAVGTHIAEGYGRHTVQQQRASYIAAKCALLRLETQLAIARHADLIPAGSFTELTARSSQVARLLAGYIVYLDRQITDREAPPRTTKSVASVISLGSDHAPS